MSPPESRIKVWDLPVRIFHWLLVALVINAYLTFKFGDVRMQWHQWNGYAILTLVVFRLIWGVVGSSTARFSGFLRGPKAMLAYGRGLLSGTGGKTLGHNPLGGAMVLALLLALAFQGTMGLFATDDIMVNGPLKYTVSKAASGQMTSLHKLGFWVIVGLVVMHVSAVLAYWLIKKENLIHPMFTGWKEQDGDAHEPAPVLRPPLWGLAVLVLAAGLVWGGMKAWPAVAEKFVPAKPAAVKKADDW